MRTAVFSIISPNYRHFARVLMDSARQQHPEWDRFVLMVGETAPHQDDSFTTVSLESLPLPDRRQFCFRYTILELNTAVKPWMIEHLFDRGYDRVVYIDPDIVVYSRLAELDAAPPETFLTLTPHLLAPIGGDAHPSERSVLLAGAYNLGFLTVNRQPQLPGFLRWWQARLERECVVDPPNALFVDQRWMDLAPGLFDGVRILRHAGYNVAYWNLATRPIVMRDAVPTVLGEPLRFFHFSGFDPGAPASVSKHDPRQLVAATGDATTLFDDYATALQVAGWRSFQNAPYAYASFTDGTRIPNAARHAYRHSEELQAAAGANPFARADLFTGMRDRKRAPFTARVALRSYRILSALRPLVTLFPKDLRTRMRELLLGRKEAPVVVKRAARPGELTGGLNVAGYVTRETGVGESARLCAASCDAAGVPSSVVDVDAASYTQTVRHRASIYHVNADQIDAVHRQIPLVFEASSYNIGCWHWELPELPDIWISAADSLHEIWAPSAFIQSAISRKIAKPVVHMPHGVEVTAIAPMSPVDLGVPAGRFTFLFMFDFDSIAQRKNPEGVIDAFRRAFPKDSQTALLIKTAGAERHPSEYAALQESVRGASGIHLVDRTLSREHTNGLVAACDAVVSLHRSEGFGLLLAEAMHLGKPAIATGWSGNMDFMNSGNSCPVGYELVTLDRTYGPYAQGQQWAEPDLDHAAHFMRRLVDDSAYREQLGDRARHTMHTQFSHRAAGLRYKRRLEVLGLLG